VVISFVGYRAYSSRAANDAQIKSIAVLPFENETGDTTMEYLADGLSESLINKLSQLAGVKVIARSSAFQYKGKVVDAQQVAADLGVQAILVGRLKERDGELLISVELVDARDKTQVWGDQYSRKSTDIQALQDEIARVIAKKLNSRSAERQLTQHGTQNPQAYQFYLNGLFHFRKSGFDNTKKALDYFNQAVALDSNFALAWIAIADSNLYFAGNSLLDPKEARGKAKLALQKALELDDSLPEVHVTSAIIQEHEWDWTGAEREYKRSLELNPNSVRAHTRYAYFLSSMERHTEAMAEIKRAQEIDPLDIALKSREAWSLTLAGRHEESIEKYQQILNIDPDLRTATGLGFAYENKGMYAQAAEEFRKHIEIKGETTGGLIYLGYDLAMSGRKAEAQAILARLKVTKDYVSPEELAGLYAGLGDKEGALAMLEKAYQEHDLQLQVLKIDRRLDSLRTDVRFQDLLRRVGLPL
jgi:TolB-like protein/Tfp pilus assembly protein PilF